ncbi:MAG TPA: hypothetical protein VJR58_13725 [Vineibacter sp.]|nr:hypothetical protein [Vineibacter sp.]
MPINWTVDHSIRLVRMKVTGEVTRQDYVDLLADLAAAGASGYRTIGVFRAVNFDILPEDLAAWAQEVGDRVKPAVSGGQMALIMSSDAGRESANYFIKRLRGRRPCEMFDTVAEALAWLGLPPDTPVDPD